MRKYGPKTVHDISKEFSVIYKRNRWKWASKPTKDGRVVAAHYHVPRAFEIERTILRLMELIDTSTDFVATGRLEVSGRFEGKEVGYRVRLIAATCEV